MQQLNEQKLLSPPRKRHNFFLVILMVCAIFFGVYFILVKFVTGF